MYSKREDKEHHDFIGFLSGMSAPSDILKYKENEKLKIYVVTKLLKCKRKTVLDINKCSVLNIEL